MWYPATVTTAAASEPVSIEEAKRYVRALDFDDDDAQISAFISAARDHIEKYCNTRFATQTVTVKCDSFNDFARLSEAPVSSITSITYVDGSGATQTLADTVYELRGDGLEASINLKYAQNWPAIQNKSRITVTAVVGYGECPPAVKQAMLLWLAEVYLNRENAPLGEGGRPVVGALWTAGWSAMDSLLCNFRRGA